MKQYRVSGSTSAISSLMEDLLIKAPLEAYTGAPADCLDVKIEIGDDDALLFLDMVRELDCVVRWE